MDLEGKLLEEPRKDLSQRSNTILESSPAENTISIMTIASKTTFYQNLLYDHSKSLTSFLGL